MSELSGDWTTVSLDLFLLCGTGYLNTEVGEGQSLAGDGVV